jgi:hypothetical protein
MSSSSSDSSSEQMILGKRDMWDLYKMDRDARKSFGVGFLPPVYADILERYFAIGEIDCDRANAQICDFMQAKDEVVLRPDNEVI